MNTKKRIFSIIPYCLTAVLTNKICLAIRLSPGTDLPDKIRHIRYGIQQAFPSLAFSFSPVDILLTLSAAGCLWLILYTKRQNAKKYRKGIEYGSARWGTSKDIKPYMDKDFENNIILTKTESLTMNNRPANPKYARNKNVLVIGGSGSGKTRFYVKPQLMQLHSSYVITDPNGYNIRG